MWDELELRYDAHGRCAVRVCGNVLEDHVVAAPPVAPWVIEARCGAARGWLLGPAPPAADAQAWLELEVARRTAAARERQVTALAALDALLIERLTHRLRTDVMTLGTVAGHHGWDQYLARHEGQSKPAASNTGE